MEANRQQTLPQNDKILHSFMKSQQLLEAIGINLEVQLVTMDDGNQLIYSKNLDTTNDTDMKADEIRTDLNTQEEQLNSLIVRKFDKMSKERHSVQAHEQMVSDLTQVGEKLIPAIESATVQAPTLSDQTHLTLDFKSTVQVSKEQMNLLQRLDLVLTKDRQQKLAVRKQLEDSQKFENQEKLFESQSKDKQPFKQSKLLTGKGHQDQMTGIKIPLQAFRRTLDSKGINDWWLPTAYDMTNINSTLRDHAVAFIYCQIITIKRWRNISYPAQVILDRWTHWIERLLQTQLSLNDQQKKNPNERITNATQKTIRRTWDEMLTLQYNKLFILNMNVLPKLTTQRGGVGRFQMFKSFQRLLTTKAKILQAQQSHREAMKYGEKDQNGITLFKSHRLIQLKKCLRILGKTVDELTEEEPVNVQNSIFNDIQAADDKNDRQKETDNYRDSVLKKRKKVNLDPVANQRTQFQETQESQQDEGSFICSTSVFTDTLESAADSRDAVKQIMATLKSNFEEQAAKESVA